MQGLKPVVIGVDLGGTRLRGGVVTSEGDVLFRDARLSHAGKSRQEALEALFGLIGNLEEAALRQGLRVSSLGVGCPGPLDAHRGLILDPPNCPALKGLNLKEKLQELFRAPAWLMKDANAAALGESWKGVAKGRLHFVLLTLGTGLGGAVVNQGQPLEGSLGMAAEIGHMTLYPEGLPCGCGNWGCAEIYLSTRGLLRRAFPSLEKRGGGVEQEPQGRVIERLQAMLKAKDPSALRALEGFGEDLGLLGASVVNLFNPEIIVIGGGLSLLWDHFVGPARRTLKTRAMPSLSKGVELLKAELGDDAGILGAAKLALHSAGLMGNGGKSQEEALDKRPWGVGEVLAKGPRYKVKRLCVLPKSRLSYQRHFFRDEVWAIVSAQKAFVTIEGERRPLRSGDSLMISKGQLHRLENASEDAELVLIETQIGERLLESDIERIEDDYGRAGG